MPSSWWTPLGVSGALAGAVLLSAGAASAAVMTVTLSSDPFEFKEASGLSCLGGFGVCNGDNGRIQSLGYVDGAASRFNLTFSFDSSLGTLVTGQDSETFSWNASQGASPFLKGKLDWLGLGSDVDVSDISSFNMTLGQGGMCMTLVANGLTFHSISCKHGSSSGSGGGGGGSFMTSRSMIGDDRPTDFQSGGSGFTSSFIQQASFEPTGVPEPAAWTLLVSGFGLAGAALRRRRTASRTIGSAP